MGDRRGCPGRPGEIDLAGAGSLLTPHDLLVVSPVPDRLSIAASTVFQLAETGNATVVVPAIVVAEFYYLSVKLGSPLEPSALLEALDSVSGIELSELGRAQLERLDRFPEVPRCTTG